MRCIFFQTENLRIYTASSSATKKRGRGRYKSIQVDMKTKYGGKFTVDIPDDIERAVGDGARDIANCCGLIMRTIVSFLDGDWATISAKYGQTMWLKVKGHDIYKSKQVRDKQIVRILQGTYNCYRYLLENGWKATCPSIQHSLLCGELLVLARFINMR